MKSVLDAFIHSLGHTTRVIDLSQALGPGIPVFPGFPDPRFESMLAQSRGDVANVEILHFVPHSGTHMDAPYHFFSNLRHVDELPIDCLIGPGIVVDLSAKQGCVAIEALDIQAWESAAGQTIRSGDMVLLRTDHYKTWQVGTGGDAFWKNGWPYLAHSAVEYLAGKDIKALGVETFSPDMELPARRRTCGPLLAPHLPAQRHPGDGMPGPPGRNPCPALPGDRPAAQAGRRLRFAGARGGNR